ncbi:unnamed protein product, partial [Ixodes pacificus]
DVLAPTARDSRCYSWAAGDFGSWSQGTPSPLLPAPLGPHSRRFRPVKDTENRRRCWALRLQDFPPFGSAQAEPVFAAKVSSSNDCEVLRKQHEDYAVRLSVEHFQGRA